MDYYAGVQLAWLRWHLNLILILSYIQCIINKLLVSHCANETISSGIL